MQKHITNIVECSQKSHHLFLIITAISVLLKDHLAFEPIGFVMIFTIFIVIRYKKQKIHLPKVISYVADELSA